MCLDLKWWSKKRTATKDIVVYKVVETMGPYNTCIQSPYQYMPVTIGKTYKADINVSRTRVYAGFHSFKRLRSAKKLAKNTDRGLVAKCIIPKGSEYYNGTWERFQLFDPIGYVSDSITYVNLITLIK